MDCNCSLRFVAAGARLQAGLLCIILQIVLSACTSLEPRPELLDVTALAGLLAGGLSQADNLTGVDRMICAAAQVQICIENDTCYAASAAELDVPDFFVIDTAKKVINCFNGFRRAGGKYN